MRFNSPIQFCISHCKVAGALQSPKGIQLHSKNARLPTVKGVYCFHASSIFIYQNPDLRSRHEKCPAPHEALQCLLYSGERIGILLCVSIQAAKVDAKTQAAIFLPHQHHGIAPHTLAGSDGTRFQHILQVIPNLLNQQCGIHLNRSLKEVLSVTFIICSMEWVQPNSAGSNENPSWYSARSW